MDIKLKIKEESYFSDFYLRNGRGHFIKDLVKKIKTETVTSDSDCDINTNTESEEAALVSFCIQNERSFSSEDPVMGFNKCSKESEFETTMGIKEGEWWQEQTSRNPLYIYNDFKDTTNEDVYLTESAGLYKDGGPTFMSELFSNEDLGNYRSINMRKNSPEYEGLRKHQSLESDVTHISLTETNVSSEKPDGGNITSITPSYTQTDLLHQSNTNDQEINKNCKSILNRDIMSFEFKQVCKCDISKTLFNQLSDPTRQIDEEKKAHLCTICGNIFIGLSYLKRHKRIHVNTNLIKCSICEKTFTRKAGLNLHKFIHEGIKPYKCNVCDKAFSNSSNLRTHKLLHEGKPHKCNFCDKAFTRSSFLNKHKLTHEKLKAVSITLI